jgi:hypothetical protein
MNQTFGMEMYMKDKSILQIKVKWALYTWLRNLGGRQKFQIPTCIEDLQWRHAMTSSMDVRHIGGIFFAPHGTF